MRVGIIGGTGWLGGALGRALIAGGTLALGDLVILNRSGARDDYFGHLVVWAADLADLVARVDVVVISVRPQDWPGLEMKAAGRLVISFMAGVGMAALTATGGRVVRAMPNAAAEIGASYTPWVAGPGVTAADRAVVAAVLGAIGPQEELPVEDQIELMTALSGAGPAYPALMATAMLRFLTEREFRPPWRRGRSRARFAPPRGCWRGGWPKPRGWCRPSSTIGAPPARGWKPLKRPGFQPPSWPRWRRRRQRR